MRINPLYPIFIIVLAGLAGCSSRPDSAELVPLEFTYIRIGQDQYSTGGLNPTYTGSISFPNCIYNPNAYDLRVQLGYEVYQILGPPNPPETRLVKKSDDRPQSAPSHTGSIPIGLIHNVLVNETVEGNSTDYTIHLWHHILNPEPVHRVDRWFNMTFTPYGPASTSHSEGEPC